MTINDDRIHDTREKRKQKRTNLYNIVRKIINDIYSTQFALFGYCLWNTHTGGKTRSAFVRVRTGYGGREKQRPRFN